MHAYLSTKMWSCSTVLIVLTYLHLQERLAWSRMYGVSMEELSNFDDNGKKKSKTVTLNGVTFRIGR